MSAVWSAFEQGGPPPGQFRCCGRGDGGGATGRACYSEEAPPPCPPPGLPRAEDTADSLVGRSHRSFRVRRAWTRGSGPNFGLKSRIEGELRVALRHCASRIV